MKPYYKLTSGELVPWLGNFAAVGSANLAALGLTIADITALNGKKTALDTSIDTQEADFAKAHASTEAKDLAHDDAVATIRNFANMIQGKPGVSPVLKEQLGLIVRKSGSKTTPSVPTNLTATALSSGVNELKWHKNGNVRGTQYVIEALYPEASGWDVVDVTTATKFRHLDQTPGMPVSYRVFARRHNAWSTPSNQASVYGMPPSNTAQLKIAA